MKDHEIRELINKLRDIAIKYHAAQQLRDQIAYVVLDALKPEKPKNDTKQSLALLNGLSEMGYKRLGFGFPDCTMTADFYNKLAASQEPLGAEAQKVLHDSLWDLYARSEDKND